MSIEPLVLRPYNGALSRAGLRGGRLLLPCLFSLRAQLLAAALATAGRAHRVPSVALHADHLVQPAVFGLGETGHREGQARAVYNTFERTAPWVGTQND